MFDPVKQRVKGTEAEAFLRKGRPQTVKVRSLCEHETIFKDLQVNTMSGLQGISNSNTLNVTKILVTLHLFNPSTHIKQKLY